MSEIKKEKWRLINSGYLSGALNMALDEAMLEACAAEIGRASCRERVLRLV